jgi:A/G-specific adenine glycosylase
MDFSDTGKKSITRRRGDAEEKIRQKLAFWFKRHGRNLPWRRTRDPYAIMVSEFMLQQTTVAAVIPYFERWMARFPTVRALADADEQAVLTLWQGLGYYSRARNLHAAARAVVQRPGGKVPASVDDLRSLPGVGEYTAAAVAAFAFDAVEPVVDANIARVLARLKNWPKAVGDAAGKIFLRDAAMALLPKSGGRLHNSALMELGALICVARKPQCGDCPVNDECLARRPELIPVRRVRKAVEEVGDTRMFVFHRGKIWLEPSEGPRWRGMWVLPGMVNSSGEPAHVEIYPITRFRVTMEVFSGSRKGTKMSGFPPEDLPPMPSPHRRAVAAMLRKRHGS